MSIKHHLNKRFLYPVFFVSAQLAILVTIIVGNGPMRKDTAAAVSLEYLRILAPDAPEVARLRSLGESAVPALQRALNSGDRSQKIRAAYVLSQMGNDASSAVPDLIQALNTQDIAIESRCLKALSAIGRVRKEDISVIIGKVSSTNTIISSYAAVCLERIQQNQPKDTASTIPSEVDFAKVFLASPSPAVRMIGVRKLASLAPKDQRAKSVLQMFAKDSNQWVRQEVAKLIQRVDMEVADLQK